MKRAQEEYDNYVQECMKQGAMKQLSDDERKDILEVNGPRISFVYHNVCLSGLPDCSFFCPPICFSVY